MSWRRFATAPACGLIRHGRRLGGSGSTHAAGMLHSRYREGPGQMSPPKYAKYDHRTVAARRVKELIRSFTQSVKARSRFHKRRGPSESAQKLLIANLAYTQVQ